MVKSDNMDLLTEMPMSSGKAVQDGAVVRPEGPPTLRCSIEERAPPTSWTKKTIQNMKKLKKIRLTGLRKKEIRK